MGTNTLDHVSELLSPYLDGQVSPEERQLVDAHLAECEQCRAELGDLRALKGMLSQLPQRTPPRSFALGPRPLRPAALSGTFGGFVRAFSSVAAALAVVVIGVSLAIQGLPRQSNVAAPALEVARAPAQAAPAPAAGFAAASARPAASAAAAQAPAQAAPAKAAAQPTASAPARTQPAPTPTPVPKPSGTAPVNTPRLAGEIVLAAAALGLAIYSIRWWR